MDTIRRPVPSCPPADRFLTQLLCCGLISLILGHAEPSQASLFKGESLDKAADVLAWIVLVIAPVVAIIVFWIIHILPEKIAEKRKHPQAKAIQTLCLLSLIFGGLLWPIAWLWAYSKPVLYKLAYGMDVAEHGDTAGNGNGVDDNHELQRLELQRLRAQLAELESRLAQKTASAEGGQS